MLQIKKQEKWYKIYLGETRSWWYFHPMEHERGKRNIFDLAFYHNECDTIDTVTLIHNVKTLEDAIEIIREKVNKGK